MLKQLVAALKLELTAATVERGSDGIFHGMKSMFLQNKTGQINPVYSISAGSDYPGVVQEHAYLAKTGRVPNTSVLLMTKPFRPLNTLPKRKVFVLLSKALLPTLKKLHRDA